MMQRILAWWLGRRLRAHHHRHSLEPATALRFPFLLASDISAVRADVQREYGSDEALDDPRETSDGRSDRMRFYMLDNPGGGACVNVAYSYREEDGLVWSIRVDNAAPCFDGQLGSVALTANVASVSQALGPPVLEVQEAPVIRAMLWLLPDSGYRIEAYSEQYDDIGGYHECGDIRSIEWFSRALAPSEYNGFMQEDQDES